MDENEQQTQPTYDAKTEIQGNFFTFVLFIKPWINLGWMYTYVAPAVKNYWLSYRNNTIIAFFFDANKNKDNAIVALASSNN